MRQSDLRTGTITDQQWKRYEQEGYLNLGKLLTDADLRSLQRRIDDIMLGKASLDYDRLMMQLDSPDGQYSQAGPQSLGWKGSTLGYRKIQELELDPLFLHYMERPCFREICARVYGVQTPITSYRAMFMNKPALSGTLLPWHQDRWPHLDRDPKITVWTALDPATKSNGCVQVIPGSHKLGLINPSHPSAFLTEEQAEQFTRTADIVYLEIEAGEVALLHNWLLHRSGTNTTPTSRRAFSVCYMDGNTRASNAETCFALWGPHN